MDSANAPTNPRDGLPPEIQVLMAKMDETLLNIPAEHRERVVRELIEEANQLTAKYEAAANQVDSA